MSAAATTERRVAFRTVRRVSDGAYADRAFAGEARTAGLAGAGRAQAHRLAFGAVQRRRTLDWLLDGELDRPGAVEPAVRDVLRVGAFELVFSDAVPAPAAVDQAVRLTREIPGAGRRAAARAGLVNAVLRRVAATGRARLAALADDRPDGAGVVHSVPDWIAERLYAALGPDAARTVLGAANRPAESAIRHNTLRGDETAFLAGLTVAAAPDARIPGAWVIPGRFALEESTLWTEGLGVGQSRASMLPALALDPQPGERVLDMCAAPGVKATQLAAMAGNRAEITCVEVHPARARAVRALAERLGARVTVVEGDATEAEVGGGFDAVLLDPPCSGLGVLAARPDARWRRRASDVAELADLQRRLLHRAIALTRPGGRVVYSTCTLLPEENEDVVAPARGEPLPLSARWPDFAHPHLPGALLTLPGRDGTDGFFVAGLRVGVG